MQNMKTSENKIKIIFTCDQSWKDTLHPTDEKIKDIPYNFRILSGISEISGYICACRDFGIIDNKTGLWLINKYETEAEKEIRAGGH